MAGNNLSPRQKMIGMMYLVLTALLALNVSKEVLNAFQNVNGGIVRTTENFNSKNEEVYNQFILAAETNPTKAGPWKDLAFDVKTKSDSLVLSIQKLKFKMIMSADKQVTFFGSQEPLENTTFDELPNDLKSTLMVDIKKKSDRQMSGDVMINQGNGPILKSSLENYRELLLGLTEGTSISSSISTTFNFEDIPAKKGEGSVSWVNQNFYDMPLVAAVTLLSKLQADIRNAESDVIKHLQKEIDAGSLKFTSAEAIQIAPSNYVFVGDSFKADVFLAAKDSTQNPVIYVGDYEQDEFGRYSMVGSYDSIPVEGGKGKYAIKTRSQGYQKWGGLISMKTEEGMRMYPFSGEYQVAAQSFVVSPTKMNVLYLLGDMGNPIDVSVPGVSKDKIRVSCNNGTIKKVGQTWEVFPKTTGKAKVTVSAEIQGKNRTMGTMEFRVKRVPKPEPKLIGSKNGKIKRNQILSRNCKMIAQLKDFDFDIKHTVVGFTLEGFYKGELVSKKVRSNKLSDEMREFVKDIQLGSPVFISNISSKGPSGKINKLGDIKVTIN